MRVRVRTHALEISLAFAALQAKLQASGLGSSVADVRAVVAQAAAIARRNFAIHGPIYIKIIRGLAAGR